MQILFIALIVLVALIYLSYIAFKAFKRSNDPNTSAHCIGCSVNQGCKKSVKDQID